MTADINLKDGTIWSGWKSSSGNILIDKIYIFRKEE